MLWKTESYGSVVRNILLLCHYIRYDVGMYSGIKLVERNIINNWVDKRRVICYNEINQMVNFIE